jgi:S1-C subfamily serine protease
MTDFASNAFAALSDHLAASVAAAAARVVAVHGHGPRRPSGLVWREGLVVTAEELLDGGDDLSVTLPNGTTVKAELVGRDPTTDVALLKVATGPAGEWRAAPIPSVGSLALAVGRGEASPIAALGVVGEVGEAWRSQQGGRIDARLRLGLKLAGAAEGGAVVAPDGGLIGMAVNGPRHRAMAIPAATLARSVAALLEKGYVARAYFGAALQGLGRRGAPGGVIVVEVEQGSPAAGAGFMVGDIITTWEGEPVRSVGDLVHRLGTDAVGHTVTLGFLRGGQSSEAACTLGERPRA